MCKGMPSPQRHRVTEKFKKFGEVKCMWLGGGNAIVRNGSQKLISSMAQLFSVPLCLCGEKKCG